MAIKSTVEKSINEQINAETYSAYLYLSMSAYFHKLNLVGFANWMEVQALEEMTHAKKFYDYLIERDGNVLLTAIEGPKTEWKSPQEVFEDSYKHEQYVTDRINKMMDLSIKESDHATVAMLQWFVTEQVEEEASASGILEQIKLTENSGNGLFMIDKELAGRVFTPPASN